MKGHPRRPTPAHDDDCLGYALNRFGRATKESCPNIALPDDVYCAEHRYEILRHAGALCVSPAALT